MMRIRRGEEPEELKRQRRWRLAGATLFVEEERAKQPKDQRKPDTGDGYNPGGVTKDQLTKESGAVCAWCQRDVYVEGSPVEHYRPREHYWWLTWTWENLLFACGRCNGIKLAKFELLGGTRANGPDDDLELEQPALLDPGAEDPRAHIRFALVEQDGDVKLRPIAVKRSKRGAATIDKLKLDQNEALDEHAKDVQARLGDLRGAHTDGAIARRDRCWQSVLERFLRKGAAFRSATWDLLRMSYINEGWAEWGLSPVPDIFATDPEPAPSPLPDVPGLDQLPGNLGLKVLVLHAGKVSPAERQRVLRAVLAVRDHTPDELAALFDRSVATARGWKKALEQGASLAGEE